MTTLENTKQLQLIDTGRAAPTDAPVNSLPVTGGSTPLGTANGSRKLPEGWVNTEKYGELYISPGGVAWVVQRIGDKLASVAVKITREDIIEKSSAERTKSARYLKDWRKSKGTLSKRSNLTAGKAAIATEGVLVK